MKTIDNCVTAYVFAMKLFDPLANEKLLRLFSTGHKEKNHNYTWVVIPREGKVHEGTMYSGIGDDYQSINIKDAYVNTIILLLWDKNAQISRTVAKDIKF